MYSENLAGLGWIRWESHYWLYHNRCQQVCTCIYQGHCALLCTSSYSVNQIYSTIVVTESFPFFEIELSLEPISWVIEICEVWCCVFLWYSAGYRQWTQEFSDVNRQLTLKTKRNQYVLNHTIMWFNHTSVTLALFPSPRKAAILSLSPCHESKWQALQVWNQDFNLTTGPSPDGFNFTGILFFIIHCKNLTFLQLLNC